MLFGLFLIRICWLHFYSLKYVIIIPHLPDPDYSRRKRSSSISRLFPFCSSECLWPGNAIAKRNRDFAHCLELGSDDKIETNEFLLWNTFKTLSMSIMTIAGKQSNLEQYYALLIVDLKPLPFLQPAIINLLTDFIILITYNRLKAHNLPVLLTRCTG